jgi:hypothetical protein
VVARSGQEEAVVNLNIDAAERPEAMLRVDPLHRHRQG